MTVPVNCRPEAVRNVGANRSRFICDGAPWRMTTQDKLRLPFDPGIGEPGCIRSADALAQCSPTTFRRCMHHNDVLIFG